MRRVLLDDHLLSDVLSDSVGPELRRALARREIATTNLYLFRLTRSAVVGVGGALTGRMSEPARQALARQVTILPERIEVVPMRLLTFRMAMIRVEHRVSTLGAEAVAAAQSLDAHLAVWEGDDGPHIRAAAASLDVRYITVGGR